MVKVAGDNVMTWSKSKLFIGLCKRVKRIEGIEQSDQVTAMILDDEDSPPNPLKAFDAFPKVHRSYVHSGSSKGGIVSIALLCIVITLFWKEMSNWWSGTEEMRVSVEKGVGHGMQLNVDITVSMACEGCPLTVCTFLTA